MRLLDLLPLLDRLAPLALAEAWDNTGLLVGDGNDPIDAVWVTIDLTQAALLEAQAAGAQLIIAYHPPWFGAKKRLVDDDLLLAAIRAGLAIYSPHTALDAALGGTNDVLADAAGVAPEHRTPLAHATAVGATAVGATAGTGMGRLGQLRETAPFGAWLKALKNRMGLQGALLARPTGAADILEAGSRIAVCAGAADSLLDAALDAQAAVFVVGEMRHHAAQRAIAPKISVVALTHTGSERAALRPYAAALRILAPTVTVGVSAIDADPYTFA